MVLRAHIVLRCAQGLANHAMARELGVNRKTVILWRKRFAQSGLDGLRDRTRPGRKPTLSAEFVQCILDTTLHEKPRAATHWSTRTLAKHPRFHFHFIPTSSSWLNLVERWFRELTQKRIRRGVFRSVPELEAAIHEYLEASNQAAKPFVWTAPAQDILAKVERAAKTHAIVQNR